MILFPQTSTFKRNISRKQARSGNGASWLRPLRVLNFVPDRCHGRTDGGPDPSSSHPKQHLTQCMTSPRLKRAKKWVLFSFCTGVTDRRTYRSSYRDARTHLKIHRIPPLSPSPTTLTIRDIESQASIKLAHNFTMGTRRSYRNP